MNDQVNHPEHYNTSGKRECIIAMQEDYGDFVTAIFCLTNAYKYLYRAGKKDQNSFQQDIDKAKWYFNYLTEKLKKDWADDYFTLLYSDVAKQLNDGSITSESADSTDHTLECLEEREAVQVE